MIEVGRHQIEAIVYGAGSPAVVIEPSFGGSAGEWQSIAERIAKEATVIAYNRAPYGASSRARDRRSAGQIVADLNGVLSGLGITGPLILIGHSMGGVYLRAFAARHLDRVAGMVLVDSSHEGQWAVLPAHYSLKNRLLGSLLVPQIIFFSRQKWRGGADRWSMVREYRTFKRLTAADAPLAPGGLGDRPLAVLTRGKDASADSDGLWQAWYDLQRELAGLSRNSRHVISDSPQHYLNEGDPDLIVATVLDMIRSARESARTGTGEGGLVLEPRDRSE
ncbi:MAG: alpha/beta hydrolase [Trebonia sp.]|jgi:pimeloyl-ACP methyl ester carboxylesterase